MGCTLDGIRVEGCLSTLAAESITIRGNTVEDNNVRADSLDDDSDAKDTEQCVKAFLTNAGTARAGISIVDCIAESVPPQPAARPVVAVEGKQQAATYMESLSKVVGAATSPTASVSSCQRGDDGDDSGPVVQPEAGRTAAGGDVHRVVVSGNTVHHNFGCLLYTSDAADE